ncbi:ABC transporter permease [Fodinicola acaciae]|uniref:ABC transporter permease n=1 Tax=Fodinicola acaciae TaxID=2681555 RepID=UPI001C9E8E84|nr:ABC transporter permease [Fodinicola acaciae]
MKSRLRGADLARVGGYGLRARPLRILLSALGIAIGIASMTAVVGISTSSQAQLNRQLDLLGTNLLRVTAGQDLAKGQRATLPDTAPSMIRRIGPVTAASATGAVPDANVYRTDRIPVVESNSIAVLAADLDLPSTVRATTASGTWLNAATARYPAVVLGSDTARLLGIASPGVSVWLGRHWFTVIGILGPVALAPELDDAALIGWPVATALLGCCGQFDGHPSTVYERSADETVDAVGAVLAATANPRHPEQVTVSRPSDALAARNAANQAFTGLLVGLGAVALLVGGVGVANTMVISALERRGEIGLRRALGARRSHIALQFLVESVLLSLLGGLAGVVGGIAATAVYALPRGWSLSVPPWVSVAAVVLTVAIGALAGLYPAVRAARLSPTAALASG